MNQTELDESLDEVDLEAVYRQPVEEPAELAPKRKRRRKWGGKYPVPVCSPEDRQKLLEFQQHKCAICGEETELHLDHSRRNGRTRGYLCRQHNTALGMFHDSRKQLEAAIRYLRDTPMERMKRQEARG
jgi:hypothetical protein